MQAQPDIVSLPVKMRRATLLLGTCLLLLSQRQIPPPLPVTALPPEVKDQLNRSRDKDDLSGWIYNQIQWVAHAPANRAERLVAVALEAWRAPRGNEEIQAWQDLLVNEGWALLLSGDIVHSTDAYASAFQWAREHKELADETQVLENILKPLGNNYTRLGDYEQALFIHQKALAVAASLGNRQALAGTYANLANTAGNMGQPALAMDYCKQGLMQADPHSALSGLLLSEEADACSALRLFSAARVSAQKSIAILEKVFADPQNNAADRANTGYWLLTAYQQAGDIYSSQPRIALAFYTRALAMQARLSKENGAIRKREQARLFIRLGSLDLRTARLAQAGYWLDRCQSILIPGKKTDSLQVTDLYGENTLVDLLYDRARLYGEQDSVDRSLRLYALCFAAEKKLRNELITGSSKEQAITDIRSRYEEAIHMAWVAWQATGQEKYRRSILDLMESSKAQLLLVDLLQQRQYRPDDSLENRIRLLEHALIYYQKEEMQDGGRDTLNPSGKRQQAQITWDLAQLRKKERPGRSGDDTENNDGDPVAGRAISPDALRPFLDKGGKIRSFFTGSQAIYTIEWSAKGISFAERLPLARSWQDSLRDFIQGWFGQGADRMIDHPREYYGQAWSIYRQLFGAHPLEKNNILLPDGALSLLPVDALVTGAVMPPSPAKWPFVIREARVSYAWSIRSLQEQILSPVNGNGFSGFFLSGNTRALPVLEAIAQEKEGIARVIKNGDYYLDEKATTEDFRKALQSSAIVHISSHAFTAKATADAPHIELFDQPFYLFELKDLGRLPALVVLSACRTGDGRMVTGEGAQSLSRAFTANGTRAVIAGWWNVNDVVTARLVQEFYANMLNGSDRLTGSNLLKDADHFSAADAADALRKAKTDWLNDPHTPYLDKLPYYWAALNYQGDPDPLNAGTWEKSSSKKSLPSSPGGWKELLAWGGFTAVILLVVLLILYRRPGRRDRMGRRSRTGRKDQR